MKKFAKVLVVVFILSMVLNVVGFCADDVEDPHAVNPIVELM